MRNEYPRPNLIRKNCLNLNGDWEFEIADDKSHGFAYYFTAERYASSINVPFSPQSPLSGIGTNRSLRSVWYRKFIDISSKNLEGSVLLNFGAVDFRAEVYVNGVCVMAHIGGFTPFTIDITAKLHEGSNMLVVNALDSDGDPSIQSGKQAKDGFPHCCGIWQSVWLEFASKTYVTSLRLTPSVAGKNVIAQGMVEGAVSGKITAELLFDNQTVATYKYKLSKKPLLKIPLPDNPELWNVLDGKLYDVVFTLYDELGNVLDTVQTYFGLRDMSIKDNRFFVNGKPLTLKLVSDEAFFADGHFTAPSPEAIKQDLTNAISLGFNGIRFVRNVADPLYLYYADKLGLIVWEEYPSETVPASAKEKNFYLGEWSAIVSRDCGHPCVAFWAPVTKYFGSDSDFVTALYNQTKSLDGTRMVCDNGLHYATDLFTFEPDSRSAERFLNSMFSPKNGRAIPQGKRDALSNPKLMSEAELNNKPRFISGFSCPTYVAFEKRTASEFVKIFASCVAAAATSYAIGFCYKALTDSPASSGGLFDLNRDLKLSKSQLADLRAALGNIK